MIIPTGYAQANLLFSGAALPLDAEVTMGLDIGGYGGSPADLAQDIFDSYGVEAIYNSLAVGNDLVGVRVKFGPNLTGPSGEHFDTWAGQAANGNLSPAQSYLIKKTTALGGRAGRGRSYLPGVPEEQVSDDGTVDSTFRGNLETAWIDMWAAAAVAGAEPVVLHGVGSPISTPTPITGFAVDTKIATQRRRLRR